MWPIEFRTRFIQITSSLASRLSYGVIAGKVDIKGRIDFAIFNLTVPGFIFAEDYSAVLFLRSSLNRTNTNRKWYLKCLWSEICFCLVLKFTLSNTRFQSLRRLALKVTILQAFKVEPFCPQKWYLNRAVKIPRDVTKNERASLRYLYINLLRLVNRGVSGFLHISPRVRFLVHTLQERPNSDNKRKSSRSRTRSPGSPSLKKRMTIVGPHCMQIYGISHDTTSFCAESKMCYIVLCFFCTPCISSLTCFKTAKKLIYLVSVFNCKCIVILVDILETQQWRVNSLTSDVVL